MPWGRVALIAVAAVVVLWMALDAGLGGRERSPAFLSAGLGAVAAVFGLVAWAMQVGGRSERAPLLAGLSIGVGGYAVARLLLPG